MPRETDGNTGHKRCKYCGVDNWHHATLDCPGIGPPLPANPPPIRPYIYSDNTSKFTINSKYGKVRIMDNTIALWCSAGEHAFSSGDKDKQTMTRERMDENGDYIEEKFALCGKHANGLFGSPTKAQVEKG